MLKKMFRVLLLCLALNTSWVLAQAEPSMADIYAAAQSGQLDKAQTMIQQVLVSHPHSAKAHYVRAELFAREGKGRLAQESLLEAERLSPGLTFAKADAVSALKAQIAELGARAGSVQSSAHTGPAASPSAGPAATNASTTAGNVAGGNNTLMWLALAGGVGLLVLLALRSRQQAGAGGRGSAVAGAAGAGATYSTAPVAGNVLSGSQAFGRTAGGAYPTPSPTPSAEPSMGSRIMGGVATGLAVGAGVMAAEAIGRRLMDHDEPASRGHDVSSAGSSAPGGDFTPLNTNADMGGSNFGVADGGWDDGGGDAGSDWDQ